MGKRPEEDMEMVRNIVTTKVGGEKISKSLSGIQNNLLWWVLKDEGLQQGWEMIEVCKLSKPGNKGQ